MLKHGLISTEEMWQELVSFDLDKPDLKHLQQMVADSVKVKERIVEEDPHEHGIRKALNLGHTFGHAFESWALKRNPILHGYAVAFGLICELYLSAVKDSWRIFKVMFKFLASSLSATLIDLAVFYLSMRFFGGAFGRFAELILIYLIFSYNYSIIFKSSGI